MKTILFASILFLSITVVSNQIAFGEKINSTLTIDGNEIRYESTNVNITDVKFDPEAVSLVLNITSDKMQDGSMTLFMSQEEIDTLFSRGPLCKIQPPLLNQLFLLVDGEEKDYKITTGKDIAIKFDIPAGTKTVELIGVGILGQGAGPQIKGIPESNIYKPGQQINLNGVLEDYCGNVISDATIDFKVKDIASLSQRTTTDSLGKFTINFTIPQDSESGRYKATLYGIKKNVNAIWIATLLVQKSGESNIPFVLKTDFGSFEIPYRFDHGEIIDVSQYFIGNSLSVQYYATQNGTMEILFPKQLMDVVIGNIGSVAVRSNPLDFPRFPEKLDSENHRVFDVPVFKGTNFIYFEGAKYGNDVPSDRFGLQVVSIGGKLHLIPYNITGGIIQNLIADPYHKKLTVEIIGARNGGHLHLELPRSIIDSIQNGGDHEFIVTDSIDHVGNGKPADFVESQKGSDSRTLEITFSPVERQFIEIQGTQMIPEFPSITFLIIGAAFAVVFLLKPISKLKFKL